MTALLSIASVVAVSLVSLIGIVTISMNEERIRRLATFFVSFAVGALLGDAFIHLIPATFQNDSGSRSTLAGSLLILGGMMVFFVVEKLLRHTHGVLHAQAHGEAHGPERSGRPEIATINIVGDATHNFLDGVLIGASYLVSPTLGVATTIAVLLHEIPQELGDFGILIHSGLSVRQALLLNLGSASVAIVGTVVAIVVGSSAHDVISSVLIPVAAGGFVYLAAADLIPELQHDRSPRALVVQTGLISMGIAVMGVLALLE